MPITETLPWDPATHLATGADRAAYLEAALEDGDPDLIAAALIDIARAKGITDSADAGEGGLLEGPLPAGRTDLASVLKAVSRLGLHLHVSESGT